MVDHAARDHALWSASSTERNWQCSGALALTIDLPESTSSAADWGTICHELAEICLRKGEQADSFIGQTRKGKVHSFEVDEEMADTAQAFVDYVRQTAIAAAPKGKSPADLIQIEQKFSLAAMSPPFEAGGTADAVIYKPLLKELEVVDLKGGRGHIVEVQSNPQLRTYALGAMLANKGMAVEKVTVTIVQPRAPHKDGRIRSETFHVADLVEWTVDLMEAMRRSADALSAKQDLGGASIAAWASMWLSAGDHCKFCKAAGFCPALEQKAMDEASVWFDDQDQPRISNTPDMMSPDVLAQKLDALDMIEDWIKAVRAHAHEQAEQGVEIPNYILVPKTGREKWAEDAEARAAAIAKQAGLPDEKVFNAPKIRTPKQVRDALVKAKADEALREIKELSFTPEAGSNLVRQDKTTRSAIPPAAHKHFDILD